MVVNGGGHTHFIKGGFAVVDGPATIGHIPELGLVAVHAGIIESRVADLTAAQQRADTFGGLGGEEDLHGGAHGVRVARTQRGGVLDLVVAGDLFHAH